MGFCFRNDDLFRSMDDKQNVEEVMNDSRNSNCIDNILYCFT